MHEQLNGSMGEQQRLHSHEYKNTKSGCEVCQEENAYAYPQ